MHMENVNFEAEGIFSSLPATKGASTYLETSKILNSTYFNHAIYCCYFTFFSTVPFLYSFCVNFNCKIRVKALSSVCTIIEGRRLSLK